MLLRTDVGGERGVLRAHVRIAHQHDRPVAPLPREHLEAVLVVEVVRALALRHVAPAARDVARRIHVFQEVQRERLVEQHGARQRAPLLGRKLLVGESARLLQRADVIPGIDADRVEHRARASAPDPRTRAGRDWCRGAGAGNGRGWHPPASHTAGRRAASACRRCAARSRACARLASSARRRWASAMTPAVRSACSGGAVTGIRARSTLSCAATSATTRIQSDLRTVSSISALEQE